MALSGLGALTELPGRRQIVHGYGAGHRITSYNVCYTKLLRDIERAWADAGETILNDGGGVMTVSGNYIGGYAPHGVATGDFDLNGLPDLAVINEGVPSTNILLNYGSAQFVTRA